MNKVASELIKIAADIGGTKFLSEETQNVLSEQIANELHASYFYMAASSWLKNQGYEGFAKYYDAQFKQEREHADKIYAYMVESGTDIKFFPIESPQSIFESVKEVVEQALQHEMVVTSDWLMISDLAQLEGNLATIDLAQWFMKEQTEEEDKAVTLLQKVSRADSETALLLIDNSLMK